MRLNLLALHQQKDHIEGMYQAFQTVALTSNLSVLRDDLLAGGTKKRGLDLCMTEIGERNIFYAGTIMGHGALALALACEQTGKQAHLFLASNDDHHPMLKQIRATNARIHQCDPSPVSTLLSSAKALQENTEHSFLFPLAFDAPVFHRSLVQALQSFDCSPYSEIWCASVSGTFSRTLKEAFPHAFIKTVSVVKSDICDYTAPEKYHRPALHSPPYPSCPYTDAKVWQFARKHASKNALIWNIAG
jgi:hypothetical protein